MTQQMTPGDWISIAGIIVGGITAILAAQHKLITGLFKAHAAIHESKHVEIDKRLDYVEEAHQNISLKVNTLETVCRLRQEARNA